MIYKNVASQKIAVYAYTASSGASKTGDAANITAYLSKDWGTAAAITDTNPTELDATNMPGWYLFDLAQAETNAEVLIIAAKSATSGVLVDQFQVFTQDATISSRAPQGEASSALSTYDPPTKAELDAAFAALADDADIADAVWDEARSGHTTSGSFGEGVTGVASGGITAASIATDAGNKVADHVIRRTFQNACDSANGDTKTGRSLLGAIAKLVNKLAASGGTLTIYEDDDTTALLTQSITTSAAAEPITELDTA